MWMYAIILSISIAGVIGSPLVTDSSEVTGTDFINSGESSNLGPFTDVSGQIPAQDMVIAETGSSLSSKKQTTVDYTTDLCEKRETFLSCGGPEIKTPDNVQVTKAPAPGSDFVEEITFMVMNCVPGYVKYIQARGYFTYTAALTQYCCIKFDENSDSSGSTCRRYPQKSNLGG